MEIILNELSLHDQFSSSENFRETGLKEILKFFQLQKNNCISILKKTDIYSRKVYSGKKLLAVMTTEDLRKSDEIRKLKSDLSKVVSDPFWDINKVCDSNSKYIHNRIDVNDSALAECYERKTFLISFVPSYYDSNILDIEKNKISLKISNFTNSSVLVRILYNEGLINFEIFCKNYYSKTKLDFSQVNQKNSFGQISDKNDELQFVNSFDMFSDTEWSDILKQSGKGKNKAGFDYKKYHNQEYFVDHYNDSVICKFRVTQKFRVFGFRKDDVFYVLEFDLTHRLSD